MCPLFFKSCKILTLDGHIENTTLEKHMHDTFLLVEESQQTHKELYKFQLSKQLL